MGDKPYTAADFTPPQEVHTERDEEWYLRQGDKTFQQIEDWRMSNPDNMVQWDELKKKYEEWYYETSKKHKNFTPNQSELLYFITQTIAHSNQKMVEKIKDAMRSALNLAWEQKEPESKQFTHLIDHLHDIINLTTPNNG